LFCFPPYYDAELIPTVILDALAYGLPIISTQWRDAPEILPLTLCPTCTIQRPDEIPKRILTMMQLSEFEKLRPCYQERFSKGSYLKGLQSHLIELNSNMVN